MISPLTLWALVAAVPAVAAEILYRALPAEDSVSGWLRYIWLWVPMQCTIGFAIFKLVKAQQATVGTSLLDAFVVWAFSTTLIRVAATVFILGDTVKSGTWFALGLLLMARVAQTFWGR